MKVAICWGGFSGYMAACWRELASRPGIDLLVFNFGKQIGYSFDQSLLQGLNVRFLPNDHPDPASELRKMILEHGAEVVSLSGWMFKSYVQLAADPQLRHIPMITVNDTPLLRTWRQRLARYRYQSYLKRMSRVVVPGERGFQLAKYYGVPESKIRRAMYGVDYAAFAPLLEQRLALPEWPRRFLFNGRYVAVKAMDVLMDAYRGYRKRVSDPWGFTFCGAGEFQYLIKDQEGVEDTGFVQPAELAKYMVKSGVLVMSSRYDAWPLALVEACSAGLPVICTEICGSSVELIRSHYNGMTVATEDADALMRGLIWAHEQHANLPEMGRRAQAFAAAYSAQAWADRWVAMLNELVPAKATG